MTCTELERGTVELYWYGELSAEARMAARAHLERCAACHRALEELELIRVALATRPGISSPPEGDWSAFMARLTGATAEQARPATGRHLIPFLAAAALLVLVTVSVLMLVRDRGIAVPSDRTAGASAMHEARASTGPSPDPALVSLTDQHFQRSKLVLLGLTTRDTAAPEDWAYERDLASSLLSDTRLYRLAIEERGMSNRADVMRDLEMVLLQTSMAEGQDRTSLEGIQRLIRRRDLLTRISVMHADGF